MSTTGKSPVVAAILNFLFPGIGYWYAGFTKVIGLHPFILFIIILLLGIPISFLGAAASLIIGFIVGLVFAYDAYAKTKGEAGLSFITVEPSPGYYAPSYPQQPAPPAATYGQPSQSPVCPYCGGQLVYVEQYGRWYCPRCQRYV